MGKPAQIRNDMRLAGQLIRYHTWPMHRRPSVGEHSWQLTRLVHTFWPDTPRHVLLYILYHDVGENGTGDIPYPVKKNNPDLKYIMENLEAESRKEQGAPEIILSDKEKAVVKYAELHDMWEDAAQERMMGNKLAELVEVRCMDAILEAEIHNEGNLPHVVMLNARRYRQWRAQQWSL